MAYAVTNKMSTLITVLPLGAGAVKSCAMHDFGIGIIRNVRLYTRIGVSGLASVPTNFPAQFKVELWPSWSGTAALACRNAGLEFYHPVNGAGQHRWMDTIAGDAVGRFGIVQITNLTDVSVKTSNTTMTVVAEWVKETS